MRALYDVIENDTGYRPESDDVRLYGPDSLGLDSLDSIELCCAIEDEYDIPIASKAWDACQTVGDVRKLLERIT
jgi:acyl carrier protein